MSKHSDIIAAADYVAARNPRDFHINGGGRYLLAVWSWHESELRAMGLDAERDIFRVAGVNLETPLRLRLRDAPLFADEMTKRGIRFNDAEGLADRLRRLFDSNVPAEVKLVRYVNLMGEPLFVKHVGELEPVGTAWVAAELRPIPSIGGRASPGLFERGSAKIMWSRGRCQSLPTIQELTPEVAVDGLPEPADGTLIIVNAAVAAAAAELGRVDLVTPVGSYQHENKLHCEHLLRVNEALPIAWGGAPARPTEALVTYDAVDLVAMGLPVDVVRAVMGGQRSDHRAHASLVGDELAAFRRGVALFNARARYMYETAPTPNRGDLFLLVETLLEWRHHRPLHGTVKAGRSTGNAKSAAEVVEEAEAELGRAPARADSETAHFRGA